MNHYLAKAMEIGLSEDVAESNPALILVDSTTIKFLPNGRQRLGNRVGC